ncbi:hypothetical protein K1719_034091 [Acacia pycnantha]|nr:hypothetical protein K1719_034091 [Acacia pycnantha]
METSGPFFTWKGPKWEGLERVFKRLDRCLCNINWLELFEDADVRVIPRVGSDHHPLLIKSMVEHPRAGLRNFRFEVAWQMHGEFEQFLQNSWKEEEEAKQMLVLLQQDLKQWNKEVFGSLEFRKKSICSEVLKGKYGRDRMLHKECKTMKSDSELWRSLGEIWPMVMSNAMWEVGDGESINFWKDCWVDAGCKLSEKCKNLQMEVDSEPRLLRRIRHAMSKFGRLSIQHVYREGTVWDVHIPVPFCLLNRNG